LYDPNRQVETAKGNIVTNQEDRNVMKTLMMVIAALTAFFIFSIMAANNRPYQTFWCSEYW